jgi:diacylglycerol diphosphate phosphatase/phosphatidate phosphatase
MRLFHRYYGHDALDWFHTSYLTDWQETWSLSRLQDGSWSNFRAVAGAIWLLSILMYAFPVYEQEFSISDFSISHPHKNSQYD